MNIYGIDPSINCTAVVEFTLDEKNNIIKSDYISYSKTKRDATDRCPWLRKDDYKNNFEQHKHTVDRIISHIKPESIVCIEDYALGGSGLVFDIAEFVGILKYRLLIDLKCKLLMIPPKTAKKYATGNGNADKIIMCNTYDSLVDPFKFDLSHFNKYENPYSDIVDAYFLAQLVYDRYSDSTKFKNFIADKKNKGSIEVLTSEFYQL